MDWTAVPSGDMHLYDVRHVQPLGLRTLPPTAVLLKKTEAAWILQEHTLLVGEFERTGVVPSDHELGLRIRTAQPALVRKLHGAGTGIAMIWQHAMCPRMHHTPKDACYEEEATEQDTDDIVAAAARAPRWHGYLRCTSGLDVAVRLVKSARIAEDIGASNARTVYLTPWREDWHMSREFRVFQRQGRFLAAAVSGLPRDAEVQRVLEQRLAPALCATLGQRWAQCAADVYVEPGNAKLLVVDVNPLDINTDLYDIPSFMLDALCS